ncbi:MAG TPA: hypothetical protein VFW49_06905 [Fluviicoccus sp.]|nr:hypothetical protein [Fluviicoccus sp.]
MSYLQMRSLTAVLAMLASGVACALESISDESLSASTAQDGVTIGIAAPTLMQFSLVMHDTDADSGALIFGDPYFTALGRNKTSLAFSGEIVMQIDATGDGNGATAGTPAVLRTNITIPGLTMHTGDIYVADTDAAGTLTGMQSLSATASAPILSDMIITFGATTFNIELGNEIQGSMLHWNSVVTGGFGISGFELSDAGGAQTGGAIRTDLLVRDSGGTDLTFVADVDFVPTGMQIAVTQLGHATNGIDVSLAGLTLGSAGADAIGNVDVIGLKMPNQVLRISGH